MHSSFLSADLLPDSWRPFLAQEFELEYMQKLGKFLHDEYHKQKIIYPKGEDWFRAFWETNILDIKVVIIGQDPYHGPNQAHGLAFSVPENVAIPPSLKNIYKELADDLSLEIPSHGNLIAWAKAGVFLLNSILTVEAHLAGSHQHRGWEIFTDKVVEIINRECQHVVFILWGSYAQKKGHNINTKKHLVLKSVHPSPLSAYRGFFGPRHFSQANDFLWQKNRMKVNWHIPHSDTQVILS